MPVCTAAVNPCSVARASYRPGARPGTVKYPFESVTALRVNPVSTFLRTTSAPGRTPPVSSLIVPEMVAEVICAAAADALRASKTAARKSRRFMMPPETGGHPRSRETRTDAPIGRRSLAAPQCGGLAYGTRARGGHENSGWPPRSSPAHPSRCMSGGDRASRAGTARFDAAGNQLNTRVGSADDHARAERDADRGSCLHGHCASSCTSCRHCSDPLTSVDRRLSSRHCAMSTTRPMIILMTTSGRPQQRHDHRLRDLVDRSGHVTIATSLGDPRSTARGWRRKAPRLAVAKDVTNVKRSELQQEVRPDVTRTRARNCRMSAKDGSPHTAGCGCSRRVRFCYFRLTIGQLTMNPDAVNGLPSGAVTLPCWARFSSA